MSTPTPRPERPQKPKSRVGLWIGIAVVAVIAIVAAFVIPQLNKPADEPTAAGDERQTVKLGVNDIGAGHWEVLADLAKAEGIDVELVSFTDYTTPNPALARGDVDMNKFQHLRYLATYNVQNPDARLVPIGATEIFPISFFSKKWKSVDEIPQGAEVTLSNNPANQVRPLLALYNAGLIEFTKDADWTVTIDDIDYAHSRIGKVTPIDPTQTAASLDSVDIAFVDTPFQEAAGLTAEQQIYVEDADRPDLQQYINVFAVREEDADNPAYQKVAELYHDPKVVEAIQAENGYQGVLKEESVPELMDILAAQEEEIAGQ